MDSEIEIVVEAGGGTKGYAKDLWRYRELFYFLAWRDVMVRYKQTSFGVAWAVIRPLITMAIFTVVFGKMAKLPSQGVPYASFVLAGMLPWQFFSGGLTDAGNSLVNNANLVSKIFFPRLILPTSALVVNLFDMAICFILMAVLMAWQHIHLQPMLLLLPVMVALSFLACTGLSIWVAALNARYRDFRHIVPFAVQFGLFVSPVGYGSGSVPANYRMLFAFNPMTGAIEGMRYCLFGIADSQLGQHLALAFFVSLLLLALGLRYFRRVERSLADVI